MVARECGEPRPGRTTDGARVAPDRAFDERRLGQALAIDAAADSARAPRAAAFGSRVVIVDEPTAALGVKEARRVLGLILDVRRRGVAIVPTSHNMPHVFAIADRIHRLGRRPTVIDPKAYSRSDAVSFMTGAGMPDGAAA